MAGRDRRQRSAFSFTNLGFVPESQVRTRLPAGGSEIRTLGPPDEAYRARWSDGRRCSGAPEGQVRTRLPAGGSRIRTLGPSYEEPRFPGPRSWTAFNLGGARVFGTATPYP